MKKILILAIFIFLVSSCSNNYDIKELIIESVNSSRYHLIAEDNNNSKKYYSYYLDSNVGKIKTNQISSIFKLNNSEFIMNLKVNSIVSGNYLNDSETDDISNENIVVSDSSTYVNRKEQVVNFNYEVSKLDSNQYYIHLDSKYLEFSSVCYETDVDKLISEMIVIAQSVVINEKLIVADYSNKNVISYIKKDIDLFQQVIPEDGRLDEMMGIDIQDTIGDNVSDSSNEYREIVNSDGTTGLNGVSTTEDTSNN